MRTPTHYASCLRLAPHSLTFRAKNTSFTTHSSPFFPSGAMIDRKGFHDDPLNSLFDRVSGCSVFGSRFFQRLLPVRSAQLRGLICRVITKVRDFIQTQGDWTSAPQPLASTLVSCQADCATTFEFVAVIRSGLTKQVGQDSKTNPGLCLRRISALRLSVELETISF